MSLSDLSRLFFCSLNSVMLALPFSYFAFISAKASELLITACWLEVYYASEATAL